jgi:hypothetical protein
MAGLSLPAALTARCSSGALCHHVKREAGRFIPSLLLLNAQTVWFPEDMLIGEDFDLWFRLVKSGAVGFLDEVLSARRMHKHSISCSPETPSGPSRHVSVPTTIGAGFFSSSQRRAFREKISADLFDCGYARSREGNVGEAQGFYIASLKWHTSVRSIKRSVLGILKAYLMKVFRRNGPNTERTHGG